MEKNLDLIPIPTLETIPSEDSLLLMTSRFQSPDDCADLDLLINEGKDHLPKTWRNSDARKALKVLQNKILADQGVVQWEVLQAVAVWVRTQCNCGKQGRLIFNRYMQQTKKVGGRTIHWETVEYPPVGVELVHAVIARYCTQCSGCVEVDQAKLIPFEGVISSGKTEEGSQAD